jgi:hypothetical protein
MTPLQISMMLHYYAIAAPYAQNDPEHANSPAVFEQRGELMRDGLIKPDVESRSGWRATPRGTAYVDALCRMPLPICKWVTP